jgi:anaerobic magnesium-protoporphyrin IX monomethyl ester cyclase
LQRVDVVLVSPPVSAQQRYGALADGGSRLPPLGIALLAALVRDAGVSVEVLDAEALQLDARSAAEWIVAREPRLVGLTAVTMTVHSAAETAELVKHALPETVTVLGGVHISAVPEQTMRAFTAIDVGVIGEGDVTLPELVAAVLGGTPLEDVSGLIIRGPRGGVRRTGPRDLLPDLDILPFPAWDLLPDLGRTYRPAPNAYESLPATSLVTSRGCPGKCTFCDRTIWGHRIRTYSAEYLVRMLETLRDEHGIREVSFHDDNFVASRKRLLAFCRLMVERDVGVRWTCTARVDMVDPKVLAAMSEAGCWQAAYGVESGSQELLDDLCKGITLEAVRDAVRSTAEAGIVPRAYFIIGTPGETRESLEATLDFLVDLPLGDFHMTVFAPHPGTELTRRIEADLGHPLDVDWRTLSDWDVVYVPEAVSREDLGWAQREAFRRFYLRPRIIGQYLRRVVRHPRILGGLLRGLATWLRFVLPDRPRRFAERYGGPLVAAGVLATVLVVAQSTGIAVRRFVAGDQQRYSVASPREVYGPLVAQGLRGRAMVVLGDDFLVEGKYLDLREMVQAGEGSGAPPVNDRNLLAVLLNGGIVRTVYLVVPDSQWPTLEATLAQGRYLIRRSDGSYGRRLNGSPYVVSPASRPRLPSERAIAYVPADAASHFPVSLLDRVTAAAAADVVVSVESTVGVR